MPASIFDNLCERIQWGGGLDCLWMEVGQRAIVSHGGQGFYNLGYGGHVPLQPAADIVKHVVSWGFIALGDEKVEELFDAFVCVK